MFDIILYPFFYWLKILVVAEGRLQIQLEDVKFQEDFKLSLPMNLNIQENLNSLLN